MPWDGSQRGDVLGGRPGPCRCRSPRCRCGAYILVHRPSTRETQSHDTSSVPFAGAPSTSLLPGGLHFDVGDAGRPRGCSVAGRRWTQNRPWMYWQVARGPGLPTGYSILAPGPHECASPCAPPWRSDMTTRVSGSEKKCLACSAGAGRPRCPALPKCPKHSHPSPERRWWFAHLKCVAERSSGQALSGDICQLPTNTLLSETGTYSTVETEVPGRRRALIIVCAGRERLKSVGGAG